MTTKSHTGRRRSAEWVAYLASSWAFLFAALSFFWAVGGRTGLHPFESTPGDPTILFAANVIAGVGKVIMGLIPLVLARTERLIVSRKILLIAVWVLGIGMCVYGGLGLISDILHVSGVIADTANRQWFLVYLVL